MFISSEIKKRLDEAGEVNPKGRLYAATMMQQLELVPERVKLSSKFSHKKRLPQNCHSELVSESQAALLYENRC